MKQTLGLALFALLLWSPAVQASAPPPQGISAPTCGNAGGIGIVGWGCVIILNGGQCGTAANADLCAWIPNIGETLGWWYEVDFDTGENCDDWWDYTTPGFQYVPIYGCAFLCVRLYDVYSTLIDYDCN